MRAPASAPPPQRAELYSELLAVAREPLLVIHCPDGAIVDLNHPACRLYGEARETLIGRDFSQFFTERRFLAEVLAQHKDYVPLRYQRGAQGRHFPAELFLRYVGSGEEEYAVVALRDISERITREREDNENERKYRALFEASPYPILMLNPLGMIVDANRCAQVTYGYEAADFPGVDWSALEASGKSPQFTARPTVLPVREHLRRDGSRFMAEAVLAYFRLHGQAMILAVVRDVTEHWNTFQQLQASEARWRFAIEGHGEALVDWPLQADDPHYVSPLLGRMLDEEPTTVQERNLLQWEARLHPDDRARVRQAIRDHLDGRSTTLQIEARVREANGEDHWLALRGRTIGRGKGGAARFVGAISDIHQLRMRKLQSLADQEKLYRLERMAAVGEMLSALAHEVNQPLTAISNYSSVAIRQLRRPDAGEDVRKSLQVINSQALRAGEIVRRIRDFVRRGEINYSLANLNQLVTRVAGWIEDQASRAGIRLQLELDPGLPPIELDVLQIEQALLNLIRNAVEAMQDQAASQPRQVVVRTRRNEGQIEVEVRDFGHGLPESTACDMFDPFVTSKQEGMGMGLAICRTIVENHGGRLWAESIPGERGTRFVFTLNLHAPGQASAPPEDLHESVT